MPCWRAWRSATWDYVCETRRLLKQLHLFVITGEFALVRRRVRQMELIISRQLNHAGLKHTFTVMRGRQDHVAARCASTCPCKLCTIGMELEETCTWVWTHLLSILFISKKNISCCKLLLSLCLLWHFAYFCTFCT